MMTHEFLTLVINLDRAPQRLQSISERLADIGLTWERLSAADGKLFSLEDRALVDVAEFSRRHGKTPLHGELGCYLSHVWAMRRFLETKFSYALILEDDVLISPRLPEVLDALTHQADQWDMVKLSGVHSGTPLRVSPLCEAYDLAVTLTPYTGSSAYVINRQAAQRYLSGLLPMCIPYDHEFDRGWHWALRVRAVMPAPCGHDQAAESMINVASTQRKFHWSQRFPAYAWRIGNQGRRMVYAGSAWLSSKFRPT